MDWTLFHAINGLTRGRDGFQDAAEVYNASAIFAVAAVAGAIWFLARPGGSLRSKLAALSAAFSAALALLVNPALGSFWFHPRPFVDHPRATVLLVGHGGDNSFPSDHASVAFAVAFAVLMFHRRLGLLLLIAAVGVGVDRILVGVHYPVDVGASVLVGLGSAVIVTQFGRGPTLWLARQLSRLSDPIVVGVSARIAAGRTPRR